MKRVFPILRTVTLSVKLIVCLIQTTFERRGGLVERLGLERKVALVNR